MKRYLTLALAALAFAACQQTVEPQMVPGKVQVEPNIGIGLLQNAQNRLLYIFFMIVARNKYTN